MKRSLAIVLATAADAPRVHALALAARRARVEVSIFLMDAGVAFAHDARAHELLEEGCDIVACGTGAGRERPLPDGIVSGSQDDHARIVSQADRTVAFT